jgi:hypothetical protein
MSNSPTSPLGPYPQPRLYGQLGTAPNNNSTRMIKSIVPMVVTSWCEQSHPAPYQRSSTFRDSSIIDGFMHILCQSGCVP